MANLSTKTGLPSFSSADSPIVNYFTDSGFERGTNGVIPSGWAQYNDGAVAVPVDGTGGAAVSQVTMLVSNSSPIRGSFSAIISKDAANRQGVGYSFLFTISNVDKGVTAGVEFEMQTSANYASGDAVFYIYNVTDSILITPRAVSLPALPNFGRFISDYGLQTGTQYRFIIHIATTNANSWTLKLDTMVNSTTRTAVPGAPGTDWITYTPTGSWVTNATYTGRYRIDGPDMEVQIKVTCTGAPTATSLTVNIPPGYTIDTNNLLANTSATDWVFGTAAALDAGTQQYPAIVQFFNTTSVSFRNPSGGTLGIAGAQISNTAPFTFGSGDTVTSTFKVPISQFAGSGTNGAASVTQWASDDGTSDVLGPQGSLVPNVAFGTGTTNRDFSFSVPQDLRQFVRCELNFRGNGWGSASDIFPYSAGNNGSGSNVYGVRGYWFSSSVFRVSFGNQGTDVAVSNVSNGGNSWATEFSNGTRFRVGLSIGGVFIGVNLAQGNFPGFYQAGLAPGLTTGAAIGAGYVGQVISASLGNVALSASGGQYNAGTLTLTPGVWMLHAKCQIGHWTTTHTNAAVSISSSAEGVNNNELTMVRDTSTQTGTGSYIAASPRVANIAVNTDFYMVVTASGTGTNPSTTATSSQFYAVRIA